MKEKLSQEELERKYKELRENLRIDREELKRQQEKVIISQHLLDEVEEQLDSKAYLYRFVKGDRVQVSDSDGNTYTGTALNSMGHVGSALFSVSLFDGNSKDFNINFVDVVNLTRPQH